LLFQVDVASLPLGYVVEINQLECNLPPEAWNFGVELARGTLEHLGEIDAVLNQLSGEWPVSRMASVDRAILRLAAYELLYCDDIPASVSINEAVELAKKYSTEESHKFVNGILGNLARQQRNREGS